MWTLASCALYIAHAFVRGIAVGSFLGFLDQAIVSDCDFFCSKNIPFRAALCAVFAGLLAFPPTGSPQANRIPRSGRPHEATGIDMLEQQKFAVLRGKRVGLISNQTGVDSQGRRTIDVLAKAPGVKLVALFSPEHGLAGIVDARG